MNKKIIILIALLTLLSLAIFVLADVPSTTYVENEVGQAKDFVYGSTSDKPYLRSTFNIYKGWNLVPVVENGNAPSRARNTFAGYGDRILGCSLDEAFRTWQIKYQYDNIPGQGYVGGELNYNTGYLKEPAKTEFETALRNYYASAEMGGQEGIYSYMFTSHWYYSEIDCSYPLKTLDLANSDEQKAILNKIKLSNGWNLISIMPSFLDKKLGDSLGDCKILKANQWNPVTQDWEYSSSESEQRVNDLLNTRISEENLFSPLAIKVANTCSLGQSSSAPPQLPN